MTDQTNTPDPVDIHVGRRIRQRRKLLGKSQTFLGEALGVSFQQIQKVERGANRISASAMYRAAKALECDISYFYEGLDSLETSDLPPATKRHMAWLNGPEGVKAAEVLAPLPPELQRAVYGLAKDLGAAKLGARG